MKGKLMAEFKVDLGKMTLGEQDLWEQLSGTRLQELSKVGLTGRRLAALIFIFAKRENPEAKMEDYLKLNMEQASAYIADDDDTKKD
jgi:hypothetical protein